MLWRLYHSSSLQTYLHEQDPCAFVIYTENSDKLCAALCGKLLSNGFNILLVSLNPIRQSSLHEHLKAAHPKKSITFFEVRGENTGSTLQTLSDMAQTLSPTLVVNCIDTSLWSSPLTGSQGTSGSAQLNPSVELFVQLQTLTLPLLTKSSPSALLVVSGTLSPLLIAYEEFFESYASGLSRQLESSGHENVQIIFMEYYAGSTGIDSASTVPSLLRPPPDVLSDSILKALGRKSTRVIPYWPQELLALFVWLLLLILPLDIVSRIIPC